MGKSLLKSLFIGSTLVAAGAATIVLKHKMDSENVLETVKSTLGSDKKIVSSWVEPLYQRVNVNGVDKYCIVGGIDIMSDFQIIEYHFLADAFTGKLLEIKKVD